MISMYYLLKPGTMAFEFLSIFIVLTVSEGVKMHLRTPVEALCILCGNSKWAVTVKTMCGVHVVDLGHSVSLLNPHF